VFSGQCEIFKTRNEFKYYDEFGNEISIPPATASGMEQISQMSKISNTMDNRMV